MPHSLTAVIATGLAAIALICPAAAASAREAGGWSDGDSATVTVVHVAATGTAISAGHATGSGSSWACGWYPMGDPIAGLTFVGSTAVSPVEGDLYTFACWPGQRPEQVVWAVADPVHLTITAYEAGEPSPDPGPPSAHDIVDHIVDSGLVDPQPPRIELNPLGGQIVHVATWIHVLDDWALPPATAHAGGIEATVTVDPLGLWFDSGDGSEPVHCATRGARYDRDLPPDGQVTDCSHTYRESRAEPYAAGATVRWSVSWTSNIGEGGTLADIVETTSLPVSVWQLQPVID